ncbi:MAG: hypothetical protein J0H68_08840 [Sphingobacteriia bacterium]|nr:hypothetical protein [Sphingobacteriia bacterium]
MSHSNTEDFQLLTLPKLKYTEAGKRYYRVYKTLKEFIDVEATTAYEAIVKSEVTKPVLVQQIIHRLGDFINNPAFLVKWEAEIKKEENINNTDISKEPETKLEA